MIGVMAKVPEKEQYLEEVDQEVVEGQHDPRGNETEMRTLLHPQSHLLDKRDSFTVTIRRREFFKWSRLFFIDLIAK